MFCNVQEEFEDTKEVIRIRKSKDRQHNDQEKKYKQRFTKHTHKTKDRVLLSCIIKVKKLCTGRVSGIRQL